jgi:hypothetical protein
MLPINFAFVEGLILRSHRVRYDSTENRYYYVILATRAKVEKTTYSTAKPRTWCVMEYDPAKEYIGFDKCYDNHSAALVAYNALVAQYIDLYGEYGGYDEEE